jgi:hypothetical protein
MAVALLALFVALGGTSYAAITLSKNSVKSRHIARGEVKRSDIGRDAVNSARVKDFTLAASDFREGELDPGPLSVTVRAVAGFDKLTAHCQTGERATGGGAHSPDGVVVGQGPTTQPLAFYAPPNEPPFVGYTPTGWSAAAETETGPAHVTAWVVCAAP